MRHYSSRRNIVVAVFFSILSVLFLNACGDANNVTGPPPPVPLSPDAKLSSLTVNPGPLPTFSSDVLIYTVDVATTVTSVTVTARAQNAGATVNINGQPTTSRSVSLGAPGSSTPIPIVVTAVSGSQNTYLVTVNRAPPGGNNNLQSLSVSPGPLVPTFATSTTNYTVDVATSVTSVTVTARAQDAGASVNINGQPTTSRSVALGAPGSSTPIPIVVTAPNGNPKTYLLTVNRAAPGGNNNLRSLTVTPGPLVPTFAASTTSYTVNVAVTVASVTVTAQQQDAGASVSINGQPTTSQSVALGAPGSSTPIQIVVTAPNGSQKPYLVTVNRAAPGGNNNLQSLTVSPGPLAPAFAAGTTNYTVDVATPVTSVTVTARAQDAGATVSINNQPTTSQSVALGAPGSSTPIQIVVTAPNGSQKTYLVTINRAALGGNNNLQSLTVSPGPLVPAFAAGTTNYTIDVATSVTTVTVTAQPQDAGASVSINNQTTTNLSVPLSGAGTNTPISIVVTAPNGSQKAYLVTVNRAALGGNNNLQSLTVSPGSLAPPFTANTRRYTVSVDSTVVSVLVTAQPQDAGAVVSINDQPTTSLSVPLGAAGTTTQIDIDVMAPNGSQKTYTVVVNRAAMIPPPTITTTSLPNGNLSTFYSQQLAATGGSGNLTWTFTGSLPDGLSMDTVGLISGTPIVAGAASAFTVQVTDALQQSDTQDLSIEIFNGP